MSRYRSRSVFAWLVLLMVMVYGMILVGGLTRLTNSGLSMVDWRPIMGAIPPMNEGEWQEVFQAYKQFPEYKKVNAGMSLEEFKGIFYWEYGHRLLGRSIGLVFFLPFLFFILTARVRGRRLFHLSIAFLLGGAQGLMGWYMVKSGLVYEPRVSHYRLAAHLGLALLILAYLFWITLELRVRVRLRIGEPSFKVSSTLLLMLISIQIFFGALTAGLDAGLIYNSFPSMNGRFFPAGGLVLAPQWLNFFQNSVTVQFVHRTLAWVTVFAVAAQWGYGYFKGASGKQRLHHLAMLLLVLLQFALGVATILMHVPVSIASLHQAGAVLLLLLAVSNCFTEFRGFKDRASAFS